MSAALSSDKDVEQYSAQAGCKNIVNSFSDFCDSAEKTIWCDFYQSGAAEKLTYSFLSPIEKESFQKSLSLWEPKKECKYLRNLLLTPFAKTQKKLVLVTVDKIGAADAPKSPLFIQLKKYFEDAEDPNNFEKNGLYPFFKQKKIDESLYKKVDKIDNRMETDQEFVQIKNTEYIKEKWRDHQSYSSLETLIPHPLDYVIDKFAEFSENAVDSLPDIFSLTGTVAHKIIELLFSPNENEKGSGTPEYIQKQIDSRFESLFEEVIQSQGELLLQKENLLELRKFKSQLRNSLEWLLKGIKENDLHVVACEKKVNGLVGKINIKGNVDMILADSSGNPYIFDFKWTSSAKRHKNLLEENKSIQFALYEELVSAEMNKKVKNAAYFLMPAAQFVSTKALNGEIQFQRVEVNPERNTKNLLTEIQNSYEYRTNEIFGGKLEENTGWSKENITYEQHSEELGLLPVDYYNNEKSGAYSDIGLIKSRK